MSDKPVTAEEVIDKLRLELEYDGMHEYSGTPTEERFEALVPQLRDLLSRYDAQPKPRWLKPEEVKESGGYWVWSNGDFDGVFRLYDDGCRYFKVEGFERTDYGSSGVCLVDVPLRELRVHLFYGPLTVPAALLELALPLLPQRLLVVGAGNAAPGDDEVGA